MIYTLFWSSSAAVSDPIHEEGKGYLGLHHFSLCRRSFGYLKVPRIDIALRIVGSEDLN